MTKYTGLLEQAFFNTYYGGVCYAPLYLFCGKHLLAAKLRPSNVDPAEGALAELQRVIKQIRSHWPPPRIGVRGDSAYSREDIMAWCESQGIDYVFGLANNARLMRMTIATQEKALAEYRQLFEPVTWYRSLHYKTLDSWSRSRRVVAKVAYGPEGFNLRWERYLPTSAAGSSQSALHPAVLPAGGDGESFQRAATRTV